MYPARILDKLSVVAMIILASPVCPASSVSSQSEKCACPSR